MPMSGKQADSSLFFSSRSLSFPLSFPFLNSKHRSIILTLPSHYGISNCPLPTPFPGLWFSSSPPFHSDTAEDHQNEEKYPPVGNPETLLYAHQDHLLSDNRRRKGGGKRYAPILHFQEFLFGMIGTDLRVANQDVFLITVETASALEFLFQLRAPPMQPDLDGIQSQSQNFSDFLIGLPLDLTQCHHGAVILRQGVDIIVNAGTHRLPHQLSFKRGALFVRQCIDIFYGSFMMRDRFVRRVVPGTGRFANGKKHGWP